VRLFQILALSASLIGAQGSALAQGRDSRAPDTDKTVPVTRGSRLSVVNDAGEVVIKSWNQDSLRVQARHSSHVAVDIQTANNIVSVKKKASGPSMTVDYEISAPAWMPIRVTGQFAYIGIEGVQSEVYAETVHGDIVVKGGSGFVTAKSIQGEIIVEDAKGKISAIAVNEGVRITGATGEIVVDSTNGDITMTKVDAKSVDVGSVNGNIRFEGTMANAGQYRFATHNGNITMVLPESTNATFSVRTYNGDFSSNLQTKAVGEIRRGRRATYTLGDGGAEVELESFSGSIRLRRPGTVAPARTKEKDKEREREERPESEDYSARNATIGSTWAARTAGAAAATIAVRPRSAAIVTKLTGSHGCTSKSIPATS
jgi:DUF4097 and DUF4098 domain-containing protein YvlB